MAAIYEFCGSELLRWVILGFDENVSRGERRGIGKVDDDQTAEDSRQRSSCASSFSGCPGTPQTQQPQVTWSCQFYPHFSIQQSEDNLKAPLNMPQLISPVALRALRTLVQRPTPSSTPLRSLTTTTTKPLSRQTSTTTRWTFQPVFRTQTALTIQTTSKRQFSSSPIIRATYNQVKRGCRKGQRARRARSPALKYHPTMKGVCLKTGVTKPKKPNSGERKTARVRLSSGKVVTAIIPGEGHNIQQHSVVQVRGGRAPDCPGVKYHLIRGAMDLVC